MGGVIFGYILNAATYSYGPIMIVCGLPPFGYLEGILTLHFSHS